MILVLMSKMVQIMTLKILYQDEHIIAVSKPQGLLSVPGLGPDKQDCMISYDNYNVFFIIEDDRVSIYGVFNPKYGPIKIEEMIEKPLNQMEIKF